MLYEWAFKERLCNNNLKNDIHSDYIETINVIMTLPHFPSIDPARLLVLQSYFIQSTCQTLSINKMNNESALEEEKQDKRRRVVITTTSLLPLQPANASTDNFVGCITQENGEKWCSDNNRTFGPAHSECVRTPGCQSERFIPPEDRWQGND